MLKSVLKCLIKRQFDINSYKLLSFRWSVARRRVVEGLPEKISRISLVRDSSRRFGMTNSRITMIYVEFSLFGQQGKQFIYGASHCRVRELWGYLVQGL